MQTALINIDSTLVMIINFLPQIIKLFCHLKLYTVCIDVHLCKRKEMAIDTT